MSTDAQLDLLEQRIAVLEEAAGVEPSGTLTELREVLAEEAADADAAAYRLSVKGHKLEEENSQVNDLLSTGAIVICEDVTDARSLVEYLKVQKADPNLVWAWMDSSSSFFEGAKGNVAGSLPVVLVSDGDRNTTDTTECSDTDAVQTALTKLQRSRPVPDHPAAQRFYLGRHRK